METFLIYLLKSSVLLGIFYLGYYFLLRKDTFFNVNRHFLLIGILISLFLPFLELTTIKFIEAPNFQIVDYGTQIESSKPEPSINWWQIGAILYCIGVFIFTIRFFVQLASLKKLFGNNPKVKQGDFVFIEVREDIAPFSFFNHIVYNPSLHTKVELEMILKHEKIHVIQYHTIDLLAINLFTIFQWINPAVWFYKNSLEQNLEFIADKETINQVNSKKEYQLTLVKVSSNNYATIANNFYQSLIKKRIVMLNKRTSQNGKLWKITFMLPLLYLFLVSFNSNEIVKIKENTFDTKSNQTLLLQKEGEKVIEFIISKNSTKKDLDNVKKTFKDEFNVEVKFSGIERNSDDEITGIKVAINAPKSNANYALQNDSPINPFVISYNDKTNKINIGQSESSHDFVWVNKNGTGKSKIIEIHSDDDKKHEVIISGSGKNKVVRIKDKNGKVITEEIHGSSHDGVYEFRTDDDNTFAFITGNDGKEPLLYIDGKESSKEKMKKLDSKSIESINVLKGDTAIKKYGKKAKNGVIEITTKKMANKGTGFHFKTDSKKYLGTLQKNKAKINIYENKYAITPEKIPSNALVYIDGNKSTFHNFENLNTNAITSINVLKKETATIKYGKKAENAVIEITTKNN
ncbi:TonB-dependent receptor plug domain-containing protein [Aquimarina gracilis]|uniref:TonB-dependent receptor plug domain-containing protein n=1 Tax=Aquimarina gracilis TaxID=874422 RepID=A0ABU5ZRN5_9FLAO|nr:TonB-dependent receptor plug domain-containing protein [Aquimarina gracilis]MEB3344715.1 TonB-dependent receptor plug domain-containing protein [Aquimarina gracilis]